MELGRGIPSTTADTVAWGGGCDLPVRTSGIWEGGKRCQQSSPHKCPGDIGPNWHTWSLVKLVSMQRAIEEC